MSYEKWLDYLRSAEKESSISGQHRRVHYKFRDGQVMMEEYNTETGVAERRAWRHCRQLLGEPIWEVELGDTTSKFAHENMTEFTVQESNTTPQLTKRITKKNIEWRIRNLPFPLEVYQVKADSDKRAIVVSTSNKKYYKVLPVQELERCSLSPEQSRITVHHKYNTLIITYCKPPIVNEMEAMVLLLLKDVPTDRTLDALVKNLVAH